MTIDWSRREWLAAAGATGVAALTGCSTGGSGSFPARDINFVIPYGPGGGFDTYVRILTKPMQRFLPNKVNVVPLNVEGAGGGKAWSQVFHDRPDGYNITVVSVTGALVLQLTQGTSGFDLQKMSWLGNMARDPFGIAVGYHSPVKTLDDLRALGRRRPIKFTSTGPGSSGRAGTLIASKLLNIPAQIIAGYKSTSDYLVAAARGDGDGACCSLASMAPLVKAKVIRIIASFEEHGTIPGVPDATALGQPDLTKVAEIRSVAAPPGLPAPIQATLGNALRQALGTPEVRDWAKVNNNTVTPSTPEETVAMLREQVAFVGRWRDLLTRAA